MENNLKNPNIGNFDVPYIFDRSFDVKRDSLRVSVVDGVTINAERINMPEMKFPELKSLVIKETEIREIRVPEIVHETRVERIEVPVIIKEIEIREIRVPEIVHETRVERIEVPVIIKEIQIVEKTISTFPKAALYCMIIQAIASIGFLIAIIKR